MIGKYIAMAYTTEAEARQHARPAAIGPLNVFLEAARENAHSYLTNEYKSLAELEKPLEFAIVFEYDNGKIGEPVILASRLPDGKILDGVTLSYPQA